MNVVNGLDDEGFNKVVGLAQESSDVKKLEMLRDIKAMRGDVTGAQALNGATEVAREANMGYEQRMAKANLKMLDLQKQLFETTVAMIAGGKPFHDMRGGDSELKIKNEISQIKAQYGNDNE